MHNELKLVTPPAPTSQKKLAVANHALYNLAGIKKTSPKILEYIKQEAAREFQITMTTIGKIAKELYAKRNDIAKSLWMAKINMSMTQTFPMDLD